MGRIEGLPGAAEPQLIEPQVILAEGDTVTIPDAHLLFSGEFSRSGADLVIMGDGQSVVIADYFGDAGMPTLAAPNGAVLLPDVVSALAGPLAPGQHAQADDAQPAQGIGSVVSLTGSATAQRSDGTVVDLAVDSRLAEGDVVQTASGSALGIVFDDGAVFNLNAESRMVLNEFVYEPGGGDNSMLFSLVQGVFAFVAGQVAPTGEMRIDTPAASMGIRGTSGIVKLETIDGVAVFRVVPDPVTNDVGTIVLYSPGTDIILVVMESSDSQWAIDPATGQVIEQPVDPGDAELIEQLHQTYIDFAGIVDDPGETDFAETGGSGLPTQFSLTSAEIAAIVALAGGAFPQVEPLAGEPVVSGVVGGDEPEGGVIEPPPPPPPPPPPEPGSSDPQQLPGGFTGDDFGSVDEDGSTTTTGQLFFDGGTGLIEPLVVEGTYGTFVIDADGNWVYTLDNESEAVQALGEGDSAEETFAVISSDGSETQFVTITVEGVNDVPTVTGTTTGAVAEDGDGTQVATGTITVDDPDTGESAVQPQTNVAGTYGTFSILANGDWTYVLDNADPGVQGLAEGEAVADSFAVTSSDGTVTETVTVTATGANDEATITGTTTGEAVEDSAPVASGTITVADPDAGESSVQPQSDVAGSYGTFSILANGDWTYVLDNADPGVQGLAEGEAVADSFTVTSFDGTATQTVTVIVSGTNDPPVAQNDGFPTDEDTTVNGHVLADNGNGPDDDVDGDPLTITQVNGSTENVGTQIVLASGALLLLNADGSFAYDPNGQFEALGPGDSAQDSFTYTVDDGQGGSNTATVTLTVTGVNDAPVAIDSMIVTNEGVAASGMLTGTDSDDGEAVTFAVDQGPTQGTVTVNPDGSYTYTPGVEAIGPDSFTYTVTDSQGVSDTATVSIDVAPLNVEVGKVVNGSDGNDVLIGSALSDDLFGGLGDDVLRSGGAPQNFFGLDLLDGGPGDDTLIAEGGGAILVGGAGNDVLTRDLTDLDYDWVRADYQSSPAGIVANLTGAAIGDLAPGEVADGFGTVDQVSNIHVLVDSPHDDSIHVDSSYSNGFANAIQVQLSGGNDTVNFDNVAHARIGYNHAGGGVLADLETGTATDLVAGNNFIGSDSFTGKVHVLRGSHFDDELYGSSSDEAFRGEGGDDLIDGRGGSNGIEFHSSTSGVHVDLSWNLVLSDGFWIDALGRYGIDRLVDIHNVTGSDWDDLIIGDAGANQLTGRLGNDTMLGGAGEDELRGGRGDDYLVSGGATARFDTVNNSYLFFEQDRLEGNAGNDTLVATGGDVMMFGGPGDDTIMSLDEGSYFDFTRVSYRSSPAGITVAMNDEGGLTVQDGFGGTDTVSRVHVLHDSDHGDTITIDSTYQTSFGTFLEVRLSSGDDTVEFVGFAGRISYRGAGGPVVADLALGTATDLNPGDGFIGTDTFIGTVGVLRGSEFGDQLYGTAGDDEIRGEGGDDLIDGRGGIDGIRFSGSNSGVHVDLSQGTVFDDGLGGVDTVVSIENVDGSDFDDLIVGDANANRLRGAIGDDEIHGGAGNDVIVGDFGLPAEVIAAGASSNDILHGEDGDDSLYGGVGQDELYGGAGNDYLESGGASGGFDQVNNVYSFFEQDFLHGGAGNDTLVATGGDVRMVGGAGDDMISSDDDGETWFDFARVSYQSSPGGITVGMNGDGGLTVQDGFGGTDTVWRVHVLGDSGFNDTITVDANYQTSFGNFIEVRLSGGDDIVTFDGVAHARIGYAGAGGAVLIDLEAGTATDLAAGNHIGNDQFFGTVHVARGTHFDDELYGSAGDEAFRGAGGDDLIDGRGGTDAIQFAGTDTGVHVDLSQNQVLNDGLWIDALGRHGIDDVFNIENVVGSPFDDLIIGDSGANHLNGGLGADRLFGGAGNDVLVSGGAEGALGNHGYEFFEQDYLDGGAGDDELTATSGDVMMVGGAGNDIIRSQDSGTGPFDFTRVSYQTSTAGIVAVMAGTSLSVQDGLGGTDTVSRVHVVNDSLHGDSITVDSNYQTSFGAFLEVRLSSGDDMVEFIGFAGRIAYVGAGGGVHVDLELGTATDVNPGDSFIGNDSITGQVSLLRGSNFNDVLEGSAGDDFFRGHGGDDFIDGRGGTNTVHFGGSNFGVHVDLSQNMAFADGHWNAAEGRYGIDDLANIHNVNGSEFADLIIGDDGANVLHGGPGGGDILLGGLGGDTLLGGEGIDRFLYRSPDDGGDTVIDFAVSEDVLVIDAAAFGGGLVGGQGLNGSQFVSGIAPAASEAHGQFLYDTSNGDLWWDGDGTGAQAAVHIASLDGAPGLTAADFQVVPSAAGFVAMNDVVAALEAGEPAA